MERAKPSRSCARMAPTAGVAPPLRMLARLAAAVSSQRQSNWRGTCREKGRVNLQVGGGGRGRTGAELEAGAVV